MTTLESGFEDKLREAILADVEANARAIGDTWIAIARDNWERYISRNDYDLSHIPDDAEGPFIERGETSVTIRIEFPGLTALFEWGVSPHTIEGSPLAFHWPGPPEGTRPEGAPSFVETESVNWGSVTGGIPEARAIRNSIAAMGARL